MTAFPLPLRSHTAGAGPVAEPAPASLPAWDLGDLYRDMTDPQITRDLAWAESEASQMHAEWATRLEHASAEEFARLLSRYEAVEERLGRVGSFAGLLFAERQSDGAVVRFYQGINEKITAITTRILFFTLELTRAEDAVVAAWLAEPRTARYRSWIEQTRKYRPHQLSDEIERLLHEKYISGRAAWTRLFEETLTDLRFDVDGESLTLSDTLNRMVSPEEAMRRKAAEALGSGLARNQRLFATITNTLAKDKAIEDEWRRYPRPVSARNLANQVEDSVVETLIETVRAAMPKLSHRYYALKARWFDRPQLEYWNRNAPLPFEKDRRYSWDEARSLVLDAYGRFSPDLRALGEEFFTRPWIDARVMPGKAFGAFAHPTVPSAHPYLLLNYHGRARDVMTLAHELGHGVHQRLAGKQGYLLSATPLTLAETASVFGEMLTFQALLSAETDPLRRKTLLAQKVEDMLNTVVRQIALFEFERRLHDARREGELGPEDLNRLWLEISQESLGPAIRLDEAYGSYWAYIPHFIHTPFYVYAYAFGDCLVNALYAVYQESGAGFARRYMDLLSAGGTRHHSELLAPFGLDLNDPGFWQRGLALISDMIDQLEASPA